MKIIILSLLFSLVSCSSFVNSMHRQMDREEGVGEYAPKKKKQPVVDHFAAYREKNRFKKNDKRPIENPATYSLNDGGPSGMRPAVKREYRPERYNANDFRDNDNDGSLWANQGSSSSLFTYQNDKRTGDMVIINVLENLRNQISSELKRSFPDKPLRRGNNDNKAAANAPGAANPAAAAPNPADNEMDMKVYDKISGTVMEEISKDYILLKGRKEVIFKKEKRSIEVQALVSRKDILENDYVNSDKLLESRVYILGRD